MVLGLYRLPASWNLCGELLAGILFLLQE
jgi:hypothetical protein